MLWLSKKIRQWLWPDREVKDWFQHKTSYSLDEFWEIYNQLLRDNESLKARIFKLERDQRFKLD